MGTMMSTVMKTRLTKIGNSQGIRIPNIGLTFFQKIRQLLLFAGTHTFLKLVFFASCFSSAWISKK